MKKINWIEKNFAGIFMVFLGLATAFSLTSCDACGEPEDPKEEVKEIQLGYVLWDCANASTHVVAALLEDELGQEVQLTSVDAGPMWTGMARGDFDAMVTAWLPATHETYYEQFGDDVVNLGANLEGARIGWVVPDYVDATCITDLHHEEIAEKFGNQVTGIDPGAGIMSSSENALETYELDYNLLSGSDAAMTAALDRAIEREEWIIVTGWTPHWKFAKYDLKYLNDPEGAFGEQEHIATIVTPALEVENPDAFHLLDNFNWTPQEIGEVMGYIEDGMEPFDAARKWIADNPEKVQAWMP